MDNPEHPGQQPDVVRLAAWLTVGALVLLGLYVGKDILIPLAIAFLISFALSPLVTWLARRGLPRVLSVIAVLIVVVSFVLMLGLVIGSQVRTLGAEIPTYQNTIRTKIADLGQSMSGPGVFDGAWKTVTAVQDEVQQAVGSDQGPPATKVEVVPEPTSPFKTATEWVVPALAPVATAGIVLVFVFLALLDRGDLRDRLIRLLGGNLHRSTDAMEEAGKRISKYLLMQLTVNVSYGIPMALGLWAIGVPGWILWGTLAALMRFIPYVGPILSSVFPLALAFAVDPGWHMVLMTGGLIIFLELVSNNIVEPLLYGSSTGLSALSLIAAATFWTALWGPVGLILSTPLTVCLLVIGRNLPQLQFFDTLLGSTPVLDIPTRIYQRLIADDPDEAIEIADDAIEATSVTEFYDEYGIEVLRQASEDFLTTARAEHRLRVVNGMDVLLADLREDHPAPVVAGEPRVACIGGKWEIDSVACEMLVHALGFAGVAATERPSGAVTSRYLDKLDLDGIEIVCLSYFSREPELSARGFCRRLRQRWPDVRIVLALWNAPEALAEADAKADLGADSIVTSIHEAVHRIGQMLSPAQASEHLVAERPENDAERVAALEETKVLDGHAREDLDAFAARAADVFNVEFAVISAIAGDREFIVGQSRDLPGERTRDGTDMIVMPREDAVCDHVVSGDETLVIEDTKRDPRFADNPAIELWDTRFYAGAPIRTADGKVLGALCILDTSPRELADEEIELLNELAADVASAITGDKAPEESGGEQEPENSATVGQFVPH
jgi:predicted PurR-regulated permease PerM